MKRIKVTDKPMERIEIVGKPMRRIEPAELAAALGAESGEYIGPQDIIGLAELGHQAIKRSREKFISNGEEPR